jgi:hypothetical protein
VEIGDTPALWAELLGGATQAVVHLETCCCAGLLGFCRQWRRAGLPESITVDRRGLSLAME